MELILVGYVLPMLVGGYVCYRKMKRWVANGVDIVLRDALHALIIFVPIFNFIFLLLELASFIEDHDRIVIIKGKDRRREQSYY